MCEVGGHYMYYNVVRGFNLRIYRDGTMSAFSADVINEALGTSQASHVGECRKWRHLLPPRHFSNTRKESESRDCMIEKDN